MHIHLYSLHIQHGTCIFVIWCREAVNANIDSQGIICIVGRRVV